MQFVPSPGWGALGDVLKVFPGPILEFNQQIQPEELKDAGTFDYCISPMKEMFEVD